jgi:hypothetical protein
MAGYETPDTVGYANQPKRKKISGGVPRAEQAPATWETSQTRGIS